MAFLVAHYDAWGVAVSVVIACFASYVTLDLARRVRTPDRRVALSWWAGGSLVMGTGIWSMHFVGMLSFSLPVPLGYSELLTFASWLAAVAASSIALGLAGRGSLTMGRLLLGALCMGAGISAMHYIGMAALDMVPGIVWNWTLVALSMLIAVAASAAAMGIFFWLRSVDSGRGAGYQVAAALVMGGAISGMHYTGMAAAGFPQGSVCRSANLLGGPGLGAVVVLAYVAVLLLTLLTSALDTRMRRNALRLASSLEQANARLQSANDELRRRAFRDPLPSCRTGCCSRTVCATHWPVPSARTGAARQAARTNSP